MWARVVVCLAACSAACYAPRVVTGTPCDPAAGCPYGLTCELVEGAHICVDTPPGPMPDGSIANPGWMIIQTRGREARELLLSDATGAGHAIIVGVETSFDNPPTQLEDDVGNTYTRLDATRAQNFIEDFGIELWLAVDSVAGARRVRAMGGVVHAVVAWEVAGLDHLAPVAATAREDNQPPSNTPSGAPITTDAPGQFVISIAIVANQVDGLVAGSPFTNDHVTFGNGWAHLTDPMAPPGTYTAQWTQGQLGTSCAASAAFRVKP